ncbi:DUF58 domain-containing protein [Candidatus Chloroploca asiatica]|uniref:DUF58 domain-containing protein n=1 Tax=Candidatus Chloroploca asiatica TaxID=1506545 RepID=UPI000BE92B71|nr:DUF58 domain-containing protein [Candidatus Chloroploca asiatica]
MWFKTIFRRKQRTADALARSSQGQGHTNSHGPLFDEAFLRRMQRMSLQAQRTLRGNPASGEHPSRHRLPATVFSDHRPYSSGDDLRYVDWNAYARQSHVLVKLGDAEQDVHIHLLLDASRSMMLGQPSRLRLAQQIVGALGYLALTHSDRLHIVPFGPTTQRPFGPVQGKANMLRMFKFIEQITPQDETHLAHVVKQYARSRPFGGILVICSDLLSPDNLEEALRWVAPPRWQTVVLHLLDQRDLQPDLDGPLELQDSETGERIELTLNDEVLGHYKRRVAAWREELARICGQRGATYAPVMSHWPIEKMVIPYLRTRRLLH